MIKKSNNQKRTDFLIKCLEVCADAEKFRNQYDCIENLDYFCNAAAILGYDDEKGQLPRPKGLWLVMRGQAASCIQLAG